MPLLQPPSMPSANDVLAWRRNVRAASVEEANEIVAGLFVDHWLQPRGVDRVSMTLRSLHAGPVGIDLLDYGGAVQISPVPLGDFHLVQIPLRGRARMTVGTAEVDSDARRATVPPVDRGFVLSWDENTPHLIVYISRDEVARVARAMWGDVGSERLQLGLSVRLDTPEGQAFLRSVLDLHDATENGDGHGAFARARSGEIMVARLLGAIDSSLTWGIDGWARTTVEPRRGEGVYRRFTAFLRDAPTDRLTIVGATSSLDVPLRTLQAQVQQVAGTSPSAMLKAERLVRARDLLTAADPRHTTVTVIAQDCGFGHLGRFAADYRARFGQSPSQTLHG